MKYEGPPKLVIRVIDGITVLTKVTLNGEDIHATRVSFDTGDSQNAPGMVRVKLEFYADIDIEMEGDMPGVQAEVRRGVPLDMAVKTTRVTVHQ